MLYSTRNGRNARLSRNFRVVSIQLPKFELWLDRYMRDIRMSYVPISSHWRSTSKRDKSLWEIMAATVSDGRSLYHDKNGGSTGCKCGIQIYALNINIKPDGTPSASSRMKHLQAESTKRLAVLAGATLVPGYFPSHKKKENIVKNIPDAVR